MTNGIGEVERNGTGQRHAAVASSNASRRPSPQGQRTTGVVNLVQKYEGLRFLGVAGRAAAAYYHLRVGQRQQWRLMVTSAFLKFRINRNTIASRRRLPTAFRWSVGATTMKLADRAAVRGFLGEVSANVVLPVATAMKSRGWFQYFCMASACQARRLTEVPRGRGRGMPGRLRLHHTVE